MRIVYALFFELLGHLWPDKTDKKNKRNVWTYPVQTPCM